ncbi:MAG: ABC transporter ATP-binding protein [Lachnospiraceae bacterium]|nr:ABC transporter ATP-binding protein [Lachnospiraceae bacterium]
MEAGNAKRNKELQIRHVYKSFRVDAENLEVLRDVNLEIGEGEFVSIVGFSGCGKSTLLRLIMGLDPVTEGQISIGENEVKKPSREVGMVFQEARLFPWSSIAKNVEFGISDKSLSKQEKKEMTRKYLELVKLNGFEDAFPAQLSGGMQQRAGIARALIGNPDILLLDEPFGALDAFTRINMQNEILDIWRKENKTMLLITHDIDEAIFLSDRIVIMSERPGTIQEVIRVESARPRDRGSEEFLKIRKHILKCFLGSSDIDLEYYI